MKAVCRMGFSRERRLGWAMGFCDECRGGYTLYWRWYEVCGVCRGGRSFGMAGVVRAKVGGGGEAALEAVGHRRTREAHLAETAQDYVEKISDLIEAAGEARVTDLAARLGVTHVTVTKTIARLKREGLVQSEPYRAIFLTPRGRRLAAEAKRKHEIVLSFLLAIGVKRSAALADAEGIEHHVSKETLAAMKRVEGMLGKKLAKG